MKTFLDIKIVIVLLFAQFGMILCKKNYNGSSVLRVITENKDEFETLQRLSKTFGYEVNTWGPFDIFVPNKDLLKVTETRLEQHGLKYQIAIKDVGSLIHEVEEKNRRYSEHLRRKRSIPGPTGDEEGPKPASNNILTNPVRGKYPTFKEIKKWLYETRDRVKDRKVLELFVLGQTYEKNDIYLLKIGKPSNFTKPALWFDCGVHAREWISISTGLYLIHSILDDYIKSKIEIVELLNDVDIYIMPLVNPDGYIYSHEEDRMWRKNRSPDNGHTECVGTDLNRNFPYHWGEARSSCYQCDEQYRGPSALSEVEARAVAASVTALNATLRAYATVHSYSQMWLARWGYTQQENSDYDKEVHLAEKAAQAIYNKSGLDYQVGSSAKVMYRFSGGAPDWAKGSVGIKYSFAIELRDTGKYGFVLPVDQIEDTGAEFYEAVKAVATHIVEEAKTEAGFYKPKEDEKDPDFNNIVERKEKNSEERKKKISEITAVPKLSASKHNSFGISLKADSFTLCILAFCAILI